PTTELAEFQPRRFEHSDAAPAAGGAGVVSESDSLDSLYRPKLTALASLSEGEYKIAFRGSAIKRTKHRGIVRNACIALGNAKFERGAAEHQESVAMLERLSGSNDPVISE